MINSAQLLTIKEAAKLLGVGVGTLRCWRLEGRGIPVIKIEGNLRYRLSDIEAYIDAHVERPSVRDALEVR